MQIYYTPLQSQKSFVDNFSCDLTREVTRAEKCNVLLICVYWTTVPDWTSSLNQYWFTKIAILGSVLYQSSDHVTFWTWQVLNLVLSFGKFWVKFWPRLDKSCARLGQDLTSLVQILARPDKSWIKSWAQSLLLVFLSFGNERRRPPLTIAYRIDLDLTSLEQILTCLHHFKIWNKTWLVETCKFKTCISLGKYWSKLEIRSGFLETN